MIDRRQPRSCLSMSKAQPELSFRLGATATQSWRKRFTEHQQFGAGLRTSLLLSHRQSPLGMALPLNICGTDTVDGFVPSGQPAAPA